MKYLLDTHTVLWFLEGQSRLSENVKQVLNDNLSSDLYVSIASLWEMVIKESVGKLEFNLTTSDFIKKLKENDMTLIGISPEHIEHIKTLPFHHRDPFDRLLIATAQIENMIFLTSDEHIHQYAVQWIW